MDKACARQQKAHGKVEKPCWKENPQPGADQVGNEIEAELQKVKQLLNRMGDNEGEQEAFEWKAISPFL